MKKILFAALITLTCWSCAPKQETMKTTQENEVIENIMARRSIRHYTDAPVGRDTLLMLAKCGINAPNAMNQQKWEVRIVDSKEYFDEVTAIMKKAMPNFVNNDDPKFRNGFRNATAAIFIACPDDNSGMSLINVGLLGENICLAAQSMGLGTCIMGGPAMFLNTNSDARPYLEKLGFSEGYKLRIVIGVGHPDETPEAKPRDESKVKFVTGFKVQAKNQFMQMAIEEALDGITKGHGGPFGSVIVKDGKIVGKGHNRVLKNNDPTCHGEVDAIRKACSNLGTFDLSGCELYTTGEPCHMCLCACMWSNISKVYYGCTIEDNGKIGFRDDRFNNIFAGRDKIGDYLIELDRDACLDLFDEYLNLEHKIY